MVKCDDTKIKICELMVFFSHEPRDQDLNSLLAKNEHAGANCKQDTCITTVML